VEFHQFNSDDVVSLQGDFEEDNDEIALELPSHFQELSSSQSITLAEGENSEFNSEVSANSSDRCDA
jgi:hypothetical protein